MTYFNFTIRGTVDCDSFEKAGSLLDRCIKLCDPVLEFSTYGDAVPLHPDDIVEGDTFIEGVE